MRRIMLAVMTTALLVTMWGGAAGAQEEYPPGTETPTVLPTEIESPTEQPTVLPTEIESPTEEPTVLPTQIERPTGGAVPMPEETPAAEVKGLVLSRTGVDSLLLGGIALGLLALGVTAVARARGRRGTP